MDKMEMKVLEQSGVVEDSDLDTPVDSAEIDAALDAGAFADNLPDLVPFSEDGSRQVNLKHGGLEYDELSSGSIEEVVEEVEWKLRAEVELQEKSEWRARDIQALRDLVLAEEGFVCDTSDAFLIKFLRAKKFDYESSFRMLQRYLGLRARSPANFVKCLPSRAGPIFDHQLQDVLPHRDQFARRVFIFRSGVWDTTLITPADIFTTNYMCLEAMGREPKTQIAGMVAVVDMAGFGLYHMMQMSVDYVKDMVAMVQNSFPIRFREIHIVNESYLFDMVFALVKPFLTDKISNRIRFHGADMTSLHRCVPKEILPAQYGGDQPAFDNSRLKAAIEKMEDFFTALMNYGYSDNIVPQEVYERDSHPYPSFCLSGTLPDE